MIPYQPTIDHAEKVSRGVEQIQLAAAMSERYYGKPLLVCYSGGKDSDALLGVAQMAGIDFEVMHSLTTADAPETVQHVKRVFSRLESSGVSCTIRRPIYKGKPATMWSIILPHKMPPTRLVRYCCRVLKETGGKGRAIATGVRRAESMNRRERKFAVKVSRTNRVQLDFEDAASLFEDADAFAEHDNEFINACKVRGKTSFQPIIEWLDGDVWQFIGERGIEYNPLYDEGWSRVGCVGCPMAGMHRIEQFERWPKYEQAYRRAFAKMLDVRRECGMPTEWQTVDDVFDWWIGVEEW